MTRRTVRTTPRRRGMLFADALVAMLLIAAIGGTLLAAKSAYVRFDRHLAHQRAADRAAESALVAMQTSGTWQADPQTKVIDLDDAAPAGWRWVRIEHRHSDRITGRITGLVRRAS